VITSGSRRLLNQNILVGLAACLILTVPALGQTALRRIAVLDVASTKASSRSVAAVRKGFGVSNPDQTAKEFELVDSDQAGAAARGADYQGSLNLELQQARDLGAAIGCDFYFLVAAQTVKRSPSSGADYFESFASVFIVSAITGRLVLWERPIFRDDAAEKSEKALLAFLSSDETRQRYLVVIRRTLEDERAQRAAAVENTAPVIDVMSDEPSDGNAAVRAPRPYRRLKPPYPETAGTAEVEAIVDALVDIDARGEVSRVEIARWAGYGLDQSVLDTVKQMHFFPAMRDGVAIPMRVLLRYNFRKPPPSK
jgi:TonB family protein